MTTAWTDEISTVLLTSTSSGEAIARIFHKKKALNPKVTLGFVCRLANISSTGYLSDVLSGRRRLAADHVEGIAKALQMEERQSEFLTTLILAEKDPSRGTLKKKLEDLARVLEFRTNLTLDMETASVSWDLLVLSSLSLFGGKAQAPKLKGAFSFELQPKVQEALQRLEKKKLISINEQGVYEVTNARLIFSNSANGYSHLHFLQESITNAAKSSDKWYENRAESLYASSIISVDRAKLTEVMHGLRSALLEIQSRLESENPTELLSFNVQIYPLEVKKP